MTDIDENHWMPQWSTPQGQLLNIELPDLGSIFYLSPLAVVDQHPVRGGVPVLFPQFADRGHLPKHGLARQRQWRQITAYRYALHLCPLPQLGWFGDAELELQLSHSIHEQSVTLTLRIKNIGTQSFAFTGGLHPYFLVRDVQCCRILGLEQVAYQDRYPSQDSLSELGWIKQGQAFERLYLDAPKLIIDDGCRRLQLACSGFTEWMIWNCGEIGVQSLADLPASDWHKFLCVEPVIAETPIDVPPKTLFEGSLTIRSAD